MVLEKQYKVIVSETAKEQILKIVSFIGIDNYRAALKIRMEIKGAIDTLANFPDRYPFLEGEFIPYNKYHKRVVIGRFIILYVVQDKRVLIEYVLDCKQDYQWLVR